MSAVVVFLTVAVPLGLAEVWDQSVRYRTDAAADRDIPATAAKLISTLWDRDVATLFIAAVCLVAGLWARRRTGSARTAVVESDVSWWSRRRWAADGSSDWSPSGRLLSVSWLVATTVWLIVVVSPLWRPHVAAVSIPLVLVIGIYRPPLRPCWSTALVAAPLVVSSSTGCSSPAAYGAPRPNWSTALDELPEGAWVISDEPGVVWRAGRRTTDDLVDPSMLRREQGRYTEVPPGRGRDRSAGVCVRHASPNSGSLPSTGSADRLGGSASSPSRT